MAKSKPDNDTSLPSAPDVERTVLGCALLSELSYHEMLAFGLKAEYFHFDSNRKVFRAMQLLVETRQSLDIVMLCSRLEKNNDLVAVGGPAYVAGLVDGVPDGSMNLTGYVDILREKHQRRQIVHLANQSAANAMSPSDPIKWTVSSMQEELLRLQGDVAEKKIMAVREFSGSVMRTIEDMMSYDPTRIIGVPFGIEELDDVTTGMREGQLVVLGGFPKSGKTSFAIDVARKNTKAEIPVGFFSREMLKEELLERIFSQESSVPYTKIRKPMNMAISEFRQLQDVRKKIDNWPLYVDDTVEHISELVPRAHLMIRKNGVRLIVVDYLQIIGAPGEKSYERVTYAVNALTALAKTTRVPILCLSQLTRPDKKELNVIPNMAMLRESGQIEQNAHVILFTYHPRDEKTQDPNGEDLIIIGAQRAGVTGRVKAFFNVINQRWEERGIAAAQPSVKQEAMFAGERE